MLAWIDNRVAATIHGRNAAWIEQDETHDRVSQHDFKDSPPGFSVTVKRGLKIESSLHVITSPQKKLQRIWLLSDRLSMYYCPKDHWIRMSASGIMGATSTLSM